MSPRLLITPAVLAVVAACGGKESTKQDTPAGVLVIQGSLESGAAARGAGARFDDGDPPPPDDDVSLPVHVVDLATRTALLVDTMPAGLASAGPTREGAALRLRDAKTMASRMQDVGALWDLERRDGKWQVVALGEAPARNLVISRDGQREAYPCGDRRDAVCVKGIGGSSTERELVNPIPGARPIAWLDDGRLVLGPTPWSTDQHQVVALDPATDKAAAPLAVGTGARMPGISPGGQVAWADREGERLVLVVRPVDGSGTARRMELGSGHGAECRFAREDEVVCHATMDRGHPLVAISLADATTRVLDDEVVSFVLSPDGAWAAYLQLADGGARLRVTPVARAAPVPVLAGDPVVDVSLLGWLLEASR